jgi:hypothetical protein
MMEPTGRGEDPQVRTTVTSRARCPWARQPCSVCKTMTSRFSILTMRKCCDQSALTMVLFARAHVSGALGDRRPPDRFPLTVDCYKRAWRSSRRAPVKDQSHQSHLLADITPNLHGAGVMAVEVLNASIIQTILKGMLRNGFPVSFEIAFPNAGASGGRPGSPIPVGGSALGTICTEKVGTSVMRATV